MRFPQCTGRIWQLRMWSIGAFTLVRRLLNLGRKKFHWQHSRLYPGNLYCSYPSNLQASQKHFFLCGNASCPFKRAPSFISNNWEGRLCSVPLLYPAGLSSNTSTFTLLTISNEKVPVTILQSWRRVYLVSLAEVLPLSFSMKNIYYVCLTMFQNVREAEWQICKPKWGFEQER